jgi:hypothetical protein
MKVERSLQLVKRSRWKKATQHFHLFEGAGIAETHVPRMKNGVEGLGNMQTPL